MINQIKERILNQSKRWPSTQLAIGVVSKATVDATTDIANELGIDLMLIPSRRQVDMDSLGSGYVEKWNASRFADYVRQRDDGNRILLCRDHGGPWQNAQEASNNLSPDDAMASAKRSFEEDIEAGFHILHLDPSVTATGTQEEETAFRYLFDLFDHCHDVSQALGRDIVFEVGTEEQGTTAESPEGLKVWLKRVKDHAEEADRVPPLFVVVQTGTKVMEMRNIGVLGSPFRVVDQLPSAIGLPKIIETAHAFGFMVKQHNTDYLGNEILFQHPEMGIDAANVAPEFGVVESKALLYFLEGNGFTAERDRFLELAYNSRKWEKWMLPDTTASDRDRAIICGHYIFSTPEFTEMRQRLVSQTSGFRRPLDAFLYDAVKQSIMRYVTNFRLVKS